MRQVGAEGLCVYVHMFEYMMDVCMYVCIFFVNVYVL